MIINNAILNIIDNDLTLSNNKLELNSEISEYISNLVLKIFKDSNKSKGEFKEFSEFKDKIDEYNTNNDFLSIEKYISNSYFDILKNTAEYKKTDIIICDFNEAGSKYLCALFLEKKDVFIDNINYDNGIINNNLINNEVLPINASVYILINLSDNSIYFKDKIRVLNDKKTLIIPDLLCKSTKELSVRKTINKIKEVAKKIDKENVTENLALAKNSIIELSMENENININNLAENIFKDNNNKEEFVKLLKEAYVPEVIKVDKEEAIKTSSMHKIKTDTGIEITFPSSFIKNNDFIEIKDGVIIIKNFNDISDK